MTKDEVLRQLIEDLISAMEYHVEQTRPVHMTTVAIQAAKDALKAMSEAPVQEPVAWNKPTDAMVEAATNEFDEWSKDNQGTTECIRAMLVKALKAAPPAAQRQWVGLTNAQREVIISISMTPACVLIATETKLKEKNT